MKKIFKNIFKHSEDGAYGLERSLVRCAIVSTVLLVVFLLFKKDNIFDWVHSALTLRGQRAQIEQLRRDNEEMDRHIEALTANRDSLETFAREQFRFSRPGDDVYLVEE